MRKNIFKKALASTLIATTILTTFTACNTKIDVDLGYKASDYVTLGDYKNINVEVDRTSIENELVEEAILEDQEENTTYSEVSRGAIATDQVMYNVTCAYAGVTISELSASGETIILGVDDFPIDIDGLEDMLYGMTAGETKVQIVTLPEDYSNTEYAGDKVVFEITVEEVDQANVPMITDAYVSQYYGYSTVEEYRESIKTEVASDVEEKVQSAYEEAVLTELTNICEVSDIPQSLYDEKYDQLNTSINFYATLMSKSNDEYCEYYFNMTFDEYVRKSCEQRLILEAIIEAEDMTLTEYQYKGELDTFAEDNGFSTGSLMVEKYGKDKVCIGMLVARAQQFVLDSATANYI